MKSAFLMLSSAAWRCFITVTGVSPRASIYLADVQEMIRALGLPVDFDERLDPSVRDSYRKLWEQVHSAPPEE
jgi:hypothetical protein